MDKQSIQKQLQRAEAEYGGMCAAAVLAVLGRVFGVQVDDAVLAAGVGTRFSKAQGAAACAYVGAAQFIAFVGRVCGLEKQQVLALCRGWQKCYEAAAARLAVEDESALEALVLARDYIERHRDALDLAGGGARPRQYYENIYHNREAMFQHSPYALEEKLSAAVTKGDGEAALFALREITAQGEKAVLAKEPLRSAKNSVIGSIAFLARAAIHAGVSANDAFALSDALTRHVEELRAREDVLAFEESILLQFIALVRRRLEASYSAPVVKVMHYVENHLDAKIPLGDAAAYAGVHPSYLSARFKRETGLAFTAYTSMRKIQESSYFVRHTGYSISEIATLYGFSSQSYYITNFKRVMGMTPAEYRRRLLAE